MTIAAGMLYDGGILMCADTLISSATATTHESKLQGYIFNDGLAIFAIAGSVTPAWSAVQECKRVLARPSRAPRTHEEIASLLKPVLAESFTRQVLKPKFAWDTHGYELIATIYSSVNGPGLYYSESAAFAESTDGCQFAGSGHDLAQFLIRPIHKQFSYLGKLMPESSAEKLMAYGLARIKSQQSGFVGGNPIILLLKNDGTLRIWGRAVFSLLEKAALVHDSLSSDLLMAFLTTPDEPSFAAALTAAVHLMKNEKRQWVEEQMRTFSNPPPEARKLFRDIRTVKPGSR